MYNYQMVEKMVSDSKMGSYSQLNVVVSDGEKTYQFHDLNFSKPKLMTLLENCNQHEVSLLHFHDILLDFVKKDLEKLEPEIIIPQCG